MVTCPFGLLLSSSLFFGIVDFSLWDHNPKNKGKVSLLILIEAFLSDWLFLLVFYFHFIKCKGDVKSTHCQYFPWFYTTTENQFLICFRIYHTLPWPRFSGPPWLYCWKMGHNKEIWMIRKDYLLHTFEQNRASVSPTLVRTSLILGVIEPAMQSTLASEFCFFSVYQSVDLLLFFVTQIVPSVANKSSFILNFMSSWHKALVYDAFLLSSKITRPSLLL